MYTQCPDCLSVFSLDAAKLAQARGRVACGQCQASFDALARLAERLPVAIGKWPAYAPSNELPILTGTMDEAPRSTTNAGAVEESTLHEAPIATTPDPHQRLIATGAEDDAPSSAPDAGVVEESAPHETAIATASDPSVTVDDPSVAAHPLDRAGAADDFAALTFTPRFAQPRRRRWRPLWIALCVVLALLLVGQLGWSMRDTLIANPASGGWLRSLCRSVGCRLPLVQDLRQLRLLARDVQSHPSVRGALMISATLRNEAHFAQPYPTLSVTLSDVDGKKLATRRLAPADYLGDAAALQRGIAPSSNVAVVLEVQDPGSRAVAFELAFE
jgi:predicted Zn finger-like uncharacterized protein